MANCRCCNATIKARSHRRRKRASPRRRRSRRYAVPGQRLLLFHDLSADLANGGVLIAGATAATDRADQLAAFDQRKSAGTCDQGGIERAYIGMAGFVDVVERTRLAAKARRGAGLAD